MGEGYILTKGVEGSVLKSEGMEGEEKTVRKLHFSILPPYQNTRMITINSHVLITSFHCWSHVAYF